MSKEIPVRAVRVGDYVQTKDDAENIQLVRKVEVVLTLENGAQDVHDGNDPVMWEPQPALPDIAAVQEEIDAERDVVTPYVPFPETGQVETDPFEPEIVDVAEKTKKVKHPKK